MEPHFDHKKNKEKHIFGMSDEDFSRENFIEGGIIRPGVLMLAFISFIGAMFLLLIGNLKWGGSLIIFSFILSLYSIYQSFTDQQSIFRTLNLGFKFVLFISEIIAFNYILTLL